MENTNSTSQSNQRALPPESHLAWAIVSTLLCCWPLGIPAIVNAAKVDKLWAAGYEEASLEAANRAKLWAKRSAFAAVAFWLIYFIVIALVAVAGAL